MNQPEPPPGRGTAVGLAYDGADLFDPAPADLDPAPADFDPGPADPDPAPSDEVGAPVTDDTSAEAPTEDRPVPEDHPGHRIPALGKYHGTSDWFFFSKL